MPTLNVTLWSKYHYKVQVPENPTMHQLAWAISLEVHKQEGKTKFTDRPRTYNYVLECLLRKTAYNFRFNTDNPTTDTKKELYAAATELTNKTKPIKVKCDWCNGEGAYELPHWGTPFFCEKCNGHGFLIERNMYRVGITFNNILIIDIDNHNEENLMDVKIFYENLLKLKFKVFKTNGGYWLFGDKVYNNVEDFKFAHCQVLNPEIKREDYKNFVKGLLSLDKDNGKEFIPATSDVIKSSKYYHGHGSFDVAFTFLSIKRERSTIRESKKHKNDMIEEINVG